MAIGMTPISPLYRIQPDPNVRFQRFGVNDSQLFGKPLVETGSQPRPVPTPLELARAAAKPQAATAAAPKQHQPEPAVLAAANQPAGYSAQGGKATEAKPGSSLNLTA